MPCASAFSSRSIADFAVLGQPRQASLASLVSFFGHKHLLPVGLLAGGRQRAKDAEQRFQCADVSLLLKYQWFG